MKEKRISANEQRLVSPHGCHKQERRLQPPQVLPGRPSVGNFKMRHFIVMLTLLAPTFAFAADAVPTSPVGSHCVLREPTFDSREVECSLSGGTEPHRYALTVNFAGGHDDTMAKMAPMINGAPAACEEGSKTSLMGEDGDVSLLRLFTAWGSAKGSSFVATFTWSHAQYVSYSFLAR